MLVGVLLNLTNSLVHIQNKGKEKMAVPSVVHESQSRLDALEKEKAKIDLFISHEREYLAWAKGLKNGHGGKPGTTASVPRRTKKVAPKAKTTKKKVVGKSPKSKKTKTVAKKAAVRKVKSDPVVVTFINEHLKLQSNLTMNELRDAAVRAGVEVGKGLAKIRAALGSLKSEKVIGQTKDRKFFLTPEV